MADDPHNTSEISDPAGTESPKEDAETKATREELKQTMISDKLGGGPAASEEDKEAEHHLPSGPIPARAKTPDRLDTMDTATHDEDHDSLKEQVSSPKKKRAHDELDEAKDDDGPEPEGSVSPRDGSSTAAAVSRTDRSEPEKKRPRDEPDEEPKKAGETQTVLTTKPAADVGKDKKSDDEKRTQKDEKPARNKYVTENKAKPQTASPSAFAASGFAKLTSSASPFGALGAAPKLGGFGSPSSGSQSPFGALGAGTKSPVSAASAATTAALKLSFGSNGSSPASSPFASLNGGSGTPKAFGGAFGGGFGVGFGGGANLSSFAKPGEVLHKKTDKPAKPFGAPDSDNEEGSEGGGDEDDDQSGSDDARESADRDEENKKEAEEVKTSAVADDKKKSKLQKVTVDDGEAGESTVFLARAKVYQLDKTANAWKERGAGILKVNVPEASVDYDDSGNPIPASFDASVLQAAAAATSSTAEKGSSGDDAEAGNGKKTTATATTPATKVVRLIMRQDHTHRVVLNTAVLAPTEFVRRETLKSVMFIFSALEGADAKPVTLQIKMSPPNAKTFIGTIETIQRELRSLG